MIFVLWGINMKRSGFFVRYADFMEICLFTAFEHTFWVGRTVTRDVRHARRFEADTVVLCRLACRRATR